MSFYVFLQASGLVHLVLRLVKEVHGVPTAPFSVVISCQPVLSCLPGISEHTEHDCGHISLRVYLYQALDSLAEKVNRAPFHDLCQAIYSIPDVAMSSILLYVFVRVWLGQHSLAVKAQFTIKLSILFTVDVANRMLKDG